MKNPSFKMFYFTIMLSSHIFAQVKSSRGLKDMREESENNSEEAEERREKRKKANQKKDEAVASRGIRDIQTEGNLVNRKYHFFVSNYLTLY